MKRRILERDGIYNDILDRVDRLETRIKDLRDAARPSDVVVEEEPGWQSMSGWVMTGEVLQDREGRIVLDARVPSITIDEDGYIQSADYDPGTAGFRIDGGTAEFNDVTVRGTIYADAGELGDLAVTGVITVGAASPYIQIDGGNKRIQSSNYSAGVAGFRIEADGDAEFNKVRLRGAMHAGTFEESSISAFAGSLVVAKSAGTMAEDYTVGGTLTIADPPSGGWAFETGDIVRIMAEHTGGTGDTWITVTRTGTTNVYTTAYQSGTNGVTYPAGTAAVDYGTSGQGFFGVSADGTMGASAAWVLGTHAGAPWAAITEQVWAGTDGKLYAGGGVVLLDSSGIEIEATTVYNDARAYKFEKGGSYIGGLYSYQGAGDTEGEMKLIYDGASSICWMMIEAGVNGGAIGEIYLKAHGGDVLVQAGDLKTNYDARIGGGLYVGATGTDPDADDIYFDGDLRPVRSAVTYTGYLLVPLTTALTSTSWDGDARSTEAKTKIDLSAVFGAPAGIKAVLCHVSIRDSDSSSGPRCYIILSPNNTAGEGQYCEITRLTDDTWRHATLLVPCDAAGDIYYQIEASGAGTMDVELEIWGYCL